MSQNVSGLPLELIDEILKHLDAISFAKSRQVCRSWRALHKQPKYALVWRVACIRDIGRNVLIELTGNRAVLEDQSPDACSTTDWEAIYREWYRSRHVGKWPFMITELKGHSGPVWDVKFSGDRVVTCGEDGTVRVWDSWTRHCITTFVAHLDAVYSVALRRIPGVMPHADAPHDLIVSGSRDCSVKVWDLKTPKASPLTLYGHTGCINCVAIETNVAASASDDCSVRVWDINMGHCCHVISNLGDWVKYVRLWQPELLLYVTDNNHLGLWSVTSEMSLSSIALTEVTTHNPSPLTPGVLGAVLRGRTALVLTYSRGLFVWNNESDCSTAIVNGTVHNIALIGQHTNRIERGECLVMHGALVAIGTRSGAVYVYHVDGEWRDQFKKVHCVLQGGQSPVNAIALDDDGEGPALVTAGDDGIVRVYRWFPSDI